jgi:hypothetical protein
MGMVVLRAVGRREVDGDMVTWRWGGLGGEAYSMCRRLGC